MQKFYTRFLLFLFLASTLSHQRSAQPQYEKPTLEENVEGTTFDQSAWQYEVNGGDWNINKLDYSTSRPENVRVEGGTLYLTLHNDDYNGHAFISDWHTPTIRSMTDKPINGYDLIKQDFS